jgi:hypothetical protein
LNVTSTSLLDFFASFQLSAFQELGVRVGFTLLKRRLLSYPRDIFHPLQSQQALARPRILLIKGYSSKNWTASERESVDIEMGVAPVEDQVDISLDDGAKCRLHWMFRSIPCVHEQY